MIVTVIMAIIITMQVADMAADMDMAAVMAIAKVALIAGLSASATIALAKVHGALTAAWLVAVSNNIK